jgi:hypothetical protein
LNKPPNKPIPLPSVEKYKPSKAIKGQYNKIVIETLLYNIDLSRLKVAAFEDTKCNIDVVITQEVRDSNSILNIKYYNQV